jgi:hypothetical protein
LSDTTKRAMNFSIIVQVTSAQTWVSFANVETKEQSKQWMHTHSPNKPKKFKQTSARKPISAVFWDRKGVLMAEFMQEGTIISSQVYCERVKKRKSIRNKRPVMLIPV